MAIMYRVPSAFHVTQYLGGGEGGAQSMVQDCDLNELELLLVPALALNRTPLTARGGTNETRLRIATNGVGLHPTI